MWAKAKRASLFLRLDDDIDLDQEDDDSPEGKEHAISTPWSFKSIKKLNHVGGHRSQGTTSETVEVAVAEEPEAVAEEQGADEAKAVEDPETRRWRIRRRWKKAYLLARTIGTVSMQA
eukprot:923177-Prorocentrum_minimum.AAC.2